MAEYLVCGWENWDGSDGKCQYKHITANSENQAHAAGLEFAFSLLEPYKNEIKHYAEYMAQNGYDYDDIIHQTMLDCTRYELWVKA